MNQYRKSPRANWLEYNEGLYFITICTHRRVHYFGEIIDAEMHFSPIGKYLCEELSRVSIHHPHINILQFVVMPNHFHAIVDVNNAARCTAVPKKMLIKLLIICFSVYYEDISMRRILK